MNLPLDILVEIFSRLPTTSIHRFRCVSSFFGSLVNEPYFQINNLESKKLLLGISYNLQPKLDSTCEISSCMLSNVRNVAREIAQESKYFSSEHINVLCSSINGLFCGRCGVINGSIVLWNPTINEFKRLPDSPHHEVEPLGIDEKRKACAYYGLGYDSCNNDYVVVRVTKFTHKLVDVEYRSNEVKLYSLRTDSWRLIKPFPYDFGEYDHDMFDCQFVNDRFHWMVRCSPPVIVSLSLSNYEYIDIPQPNYRDVPNYREVTVLDGMLCVGCNYVLDSFDLWVMKDYGIQESWMLMLSIPDQDIFGTVDLDTRFELFDDLGYYPLYLFENGDVLLKIGKGKKRCIVIYKKDERTLMTIHVDEPAGVVAQGAIYAKYADIYEETLISPNCFLRKG